MRAWLLELFRFATLKREAILKLLQAERRRLETRSLIFDPGRRLAINHGIARSTDDQALEFEYPAYALNGDTAPQELSPRAAILKSTQCQIIPKVYHCSRVLSDEKDARVNRHVGIPNGSTAFSYPRSFHLTWRCLVDPVLRRADFTAEVHGSQALRVVIF